MILSVVIVSYNVKFFLEQCLSSLKKAIEEGSIPAGMWEVFIVDNASTDGSLDFLIPMFPGFHFIRNTDNKGFSKANNQALSLCTGEYILFLNPDIILAEDSLDICLSFFKSGNNAGAVGVHMIDGAGNYLNESKRGFPSPRASFFRMSGLARLFPRSKFFSAYYMGHLSEKELHPVDILSGAFMMIPKAVLEKTGGFDEQFFMYGEDIDLSYRILQAGYQNYYLPGTTIIHFKGESTRKDFQNIKIFYQAMELFMKKHPGAGSSTVQLFLLKGGVRFYMGLSYLRLRIIKSKGKSGSPLRIFITGDRGSEQSWKRWFAAKKIQVSEDIKDAEEIIYCEGPYLSWKLIISQVKNNKNRFVFKFHGAGTHAAVGSNSSRKPGEVFEL